MLRTTRFILPIMFVVACLCACASSDDELPDCQGGIDAYVRLCPTSTVDDSADKQLKLGDCKNYEMFDSPELVTKYRNRAKKWVSCVKAATTCSAAKACQFSE